jgi:hypothetical protein
MGEVWRAEDSRLGRVVAIKVLPPSFVADVEATARLKREARTAAQLYHPSIATIHSIEQDGDHIFIVEEFVEGEPLSKVIRRGGLSESEICRIGRAVADALAEAHAKGIVHRDIKPDNIIVNGNRVKVLDFGIAKQVGLAGASAEDTPTAAFVTQQGMILGTIHYMSPEQALGKAIDGRADVFSLGVVLYEMATGRRPFAGETITETMTQIIRDEPTEPVVVNPGISPGMNEIIQHSLRKNPSERFTSAELVTVLDAQIGRAPTAPYTSANEVTAKAAAPTILTGAKTIQESAPRRRSAVPAVIAVMVVVIAAAAGVIYTRRPAPQAAAPKPQPVAPPSTTSVSVIAPETGTSRTEESCRAAAGNDQHVTANEGRRDASACAADAAARPGLRAQSRRPLRHGDVRASRRRRAASAQDAASRPPPRPALRQSALSDGRDRALQSQSQSCDGRAEPRPRRFRPPRSARTAADPSQPGARLPQSIRLATHRRRDLPTLAR